MTYRNHFLKEHIPTVKNEEACIVELCGRIALNTKKLNYEEVDRFMKDLDRSWQVILDLNEIKRNKEEELRRGYF